jgi:hypothetical protein
MEDLYWFGLMGVGVLCLAIMAWRPNKEREW